MIENKEVKVKQEKLRPCMTCPLCHKLFKNATSVIECLHTFCRKCIRKKLLEEDMDCCPVCNISLGCSPLEKLRPDHNLQDLRSKLFPSKRVIAKEPRILTPPVVVLPAKRKERSLSSLVVSTPRVYTHVGKTGSRSKSGSRKASKSSSLSTDNQNSTSNEMLRRSTPDVNQNSSACEVSARLVSDKRGDFGSDKVEATSDLWKPLTFLVEAVNQSKSTKVSSQGSVPTSKASKPDDLEDARRNTENKAKQKEVKVKNENCFKENVPTKVHKPTKPSTTNKELLDSKELILPQPAIVSADMSAKLDPRKHPIWFSLVASDEVKGDLPPLPQISASFLRIKDGSIPVLLIEKYLKKKLDLSNEVEVEIKCMGQMINPSLTLDQLVELWLQTPTAKLPVPAKVGESAKDFLLVLTYARRNSHPTTS